MDAFLSFIPSRTFVQIYTYKNTLLKEISSEGARKAFQVKTKKKTNHGDIQM